MSKSSNSNFVKRVKDADCCNILGVGPLRGKWQTSCLKWLVKNYVKWENQRPYILKMSMFPNFCTVFDLDFRFEEKNEISHDTLIEHAHQLREIIKSETGKDVRILITRKPVMCYKKMLKKLEKGYCWASGCHMYLLKHRFTQSEAITIRGEVRTTFKRTKFFGRRP